MLKDNLPYCSLLFFPLFFFVFPLFTFDYSSYVDEIVISRRQLQVYIRKPGIKDPVEIDKYCPLVSKNLDENFINQYPFDRNLSHYEVSEAFWIQKGGRYKPRDCISRNKVAILLPVQNRDFQLSITAPYLHTFLNGQLVDYQIFVIELEQNDKGFNKGLLYNAGFLEINKLDKFDCFIFSDVDLLPENQFNIYTCFELPRHLSANVNSLRYVLTYSSLFGGVFSLLTEDYKRINGFSNKYWGWGGEDDDLSKRLKYFNYTILRNNDVGYYTMLPHAHSSINQKRNKLLNEPVENYKMDGLSNVKYKVLEMEEQYLYTKFKIKIV